MKLLEKFKTHLSSKKNRPSKITIKNYLSDIRKFINWFEVQSHTDFNPEKITPETINVYKQYLSRHETPLSSVERYLSSLRGFFNFITNENLIRANPFSRKTDLKQPPPDPFMIDKFRIFLLSGNISKLTIKNYLVDIKQLLTWVEKTINPQGTDIVKHINISVINEYKYQLTYQAGLSPVSVNRKLSSLRKYINWIDTLPTTGSNTGIKSKLFKNLKEENNKKIHEKINNSNSSSIKQTKKSINIINTLTDLIITLPIVKLLEKSKFLLWKIKGADVFTPQHNYQSIKNIRNVSKPTSSPFKVLIRSLPRHKKIYFHLRYTRPKWYKIYHSYTLAHYFHMGLLFLFTTVTGTLLYYSLYGNYLPQQKTAFASPPWTRPRILAFQGKLADSYNNPITQTTALRFAIYNHPSSTGSALLWQEVQTINPDNDGLFKTQIGEKNPISSTIFSDNPALYLGMTVGQDKELQPRRELATVARSKDAQQLQGLIPITKDGAGTSNVILALDSAGNLTIGGKATPTFEASGGRFTLSGQALLLTSVTGSDGNISISPDGRGIIDFQKPLQNTTNNNNIGSAQGAVEIDDILAVLATSSAQSAFTINQNSTGPLISASTGGIAMFTLENNGTGVFAGNLIIKGNNLNTSSTTFNLLNAASFISLGSDSGNTTINNTLIAKSAYIDNLYPSAIASVSGFWQKNKDTLSPFYSTDGLLIAGTTPENAKFQILGSGAKAGTASTSGQLTFTTDSQINLLNKAGLGFYNSMAGDPGINTANPALYISSSGNIGIGTNNPSAKLEINGNIRVREIYATETQVQQADLAENYISSQFLEAGDVIMLEGKDNNLAVIKTTKPYESKTIGIVSTKPGITLNSDAAPDNTHPYVIPIALSGRVPVKVTTENGSIEAGDYLSTSGVPGVAMKATGKSITIGKALEGYTNSNPETIGKIMVSVNLSYFDPSISTGYYDKYNPQDNNHEIYSLMQTLTQVLVDNFRAKLIQAQQTITGSLTVTTDNIMIGSQTLKEYITEIVRNSLQKEVEKEIAKYHIQNTKYPASDLLSPLASESAIVFELDHSSSAGGSIQINTAIASNSALQNITNITNIYNTITATPAADLYQASNSALLSNPIASDSALTDSPIASISAKPGVDLSLTSDSALENIPASAINNSIIQQFNNLTMQQFNNDYANLASLSGQLSYTPNLNALSNLQVFGHSTLSDVAIVGNLNVNGSLILADNSINALGSNLELQSLRQGNLSIMGDLISIDTNGNLKVSGKASFAKDVTIQGTLSANIIAPIPDSDLVIQLGNNPNSQPAEALSKKGQFSIHNASDSAVFSVNQQGDIRASGSGTFSSLAAKAFNIVRGAQADTSLIQTTASSSAGTAVITAYETERTIISPFISKDSLIYLTAASDTQGLIPYIARQTEKDFTIAIPYAINKEIKVNWWIVN